MKYRRGWPWKHQKSAWVALESWKIVVTRVLDNTDFLFANWMPPTRIFITHCVHKNRCCWAAGPQWFSSRKNDVPDFAIFQNVQNWGRPFFYLKIGVAGAPDHTDFCGRSGWWKSAWVPWFGRVILQKMVYRCHVKNLDGLISRPQQSAPPFSYHCFIPPNQLFRSSRKPWSDLGNQEMLEALYPCCLQICWNKQWLSLDSRQNFSCQPFPACLHFSCWTSSCA